MTFTSYVTPLTSANFSDCI